MTVREVRAVATVAISKGGTGTERLPISYPPYALFGGLSLSLVSLYEHLFPYLPYVSISYHELPSLYMGLQAFPLILFGL